MKLKQQGIIYCTYFDKNYLLKGLSMCSSFLRHNPTAKLWVLSFDSYTDEILNKLNLKRVTVIHLADFEDKQLLKAKQNRSLVEYYWTCTPSLPLYIFKKNPKIKKVIYLDADLFFYSSVTPVFVELGDKSILTVEHRYPKGQESRIKTSGRFNVGFQIFNRDKEGLSCLKRWRKQCLDWCFWRLEDGKLGDQLYLNEWPNLYSKLVISQNFGLNAAPWNISQYWVSKKNDRVYINEDRLICYHFHQFQILRENSFEFSSGYYFSKIVQDYIYKKYILDLERQIKNLKRLDKSFTINYVQRGKISLLKVSFKKLIGPYYWRLNTILDNFKSD